MKLKLIPQGEIQILEITETILPEESAILRAGLTKLFVDAGGSGKKWFVLDLTRAQISQPDLQADVKKMPEIAKSYGAMIWIASPIEGLGNAPDLAGTLQLARSREERTKLEALLTQSQIERLQREKSNYSAQLKTSEKVIIEIRTLQGSLSQIRRNNHRLANRVQTLIKSLPKLISENRAPTSTPHLWSLLEPVLKQQGIQIPQPAMTDVKGEPKP